MAQEDIGVVSSVAHESIDGALVVKTLGREQLETRSSRTPRGPCATTACAADTCARPSRPGWTHCRRSPPSCSSRSARGGSTRARSTPATSIGLVGAVRSALVADAVHRVDPRRAAACGRRLRPACRPCSPSRSRSCHRPDPEPLPDGPLGLSVRDVYLIYDGQPVLDGVSFDVEPGESVAIVGPTGVGKSTMVQLLVRLADPDEGAVLVGGIDVRETDPLRAAAGGLDRVPGELPVRGERRARTSRSTPRSTATRSCGRR